MKQKVGHCSLDQHSGVQHAPETQNFEKSVCIYVPYFHPLEHRYIYLLTSDWLWSISGGWTVRFGLPIDDDPMRHPILFSSVLLNVEPVEEQCWKGIWPSIQHRANTNQYGGAAPLYYSINWLAYEELNSQYELWSNVSRYFVILIEPSKTNSNFIRKTCIIICSGFARTQG